MENSSCNRKHLWRHYAILVAILFGIFFLLSEPLTLSCRAENQNQDQTWDYAQNRSEGFDQNRVEDGTKDIEDPIDFTSFSLEELKQVMIISVLKKTQKLSEATSAISVITQDDIRRSGATSIPELLRGIPGFQVAQINSNAWAVSSRGFNHRYANKLLVLMDGRSLYTPLFSGVNWNVQDTLFEDIDRIEVIRGPGATLWGANAVNGVINIITKKARDTQGGLVTSGIGTEEKRFGSFRYGNKVGTNTYGKIYLKYFDRDNFVYTSGDEGNDRWDSVRGGGRVDCSLSSQNSFTFQGDIYDDKNSDKMVSFDWKTKSEKEIDIENNFSGGNLLGRWSHMFSHTSNMALQLYYDRTNNVANFSNGCQNTARFDTFDLDFQHNFRLGHSQEIIWGLGYRFISDHFEAKPAEKSFLLLDPDSRDTQIISVYLQDGIEVLKDRLNLTLGSKFEHNDYTGFEVQPSLRMLWNLTKNQNMWAAVSRAVRTPSRSEYDARPPKPPLPPPEESSSPDSSHSSDWTKADFNIESEELIAYELGYRLQPIANLSLDLALFYNDYDNLLIQSFITAEAKNQGMELGLNWDPLKWWSFRASFTYLHMNLDLYDKDLSSFNDYAKDKDVPPFDLFVEKTSPESQFVLHSSVDLSRNLELDLDLRCVDPLYFYVDSYREIDARLGWSPRENLEISIVGKNLLNNHHLEFLSHGHLPNSADYNLEVERGVYGKITCLF